MQPDFWNDKRPAGVPLDIDQGAYLFLSSLPEPIRGHSLHCQKNKKQKAELHGH